MVDELFLILLNEANDFVCNKKVKFGKLTVPVNNLLQLKQKQAASKGCYITKHPVIFRRNKHGQAL